MSLTFAMREPEEEEVDALAAAGMHVLGADDEEDEDGVEKKIEVVAIDEDRAEIVDELKELERLEREVQSESEPSPIEIEEE